MMDPRFLSRRAAIAGIALAFVAGCPKDDDKPSDSDSDKGKDKDKPAEAPKASPANDAYAMGRKYAFACVFAMLDKPDNVAKNVAQASAKASALGISAPSSPPKEGAMDTMRGSTIPDEIEKKHDAKIAAAYRLGVTMTDVFFGVTLETDVSSQLSDVATHAAKAGVPESVYSSQLSAAKAGASDATAEALSKALDAHHKYSD